MNELEKILSEEAAAKAFLKNVIDVTAKVPAILEQIKLLKDHVEAFKDIDPAVVLERIDEMKSGLEEIREKIGKNENGGLYVPGLYEHKSKFSLLKAMVAVKMGGDDKHFEACKAGFELEVIKAARQVKHGEGQVVGIDSQGGFFVPDQVIPDVIQAIYTRSILIDLAGDGQTRVSVLDGLVGSPVKIPKFDGGVLAFWIGEQDDFIESKSKVGNVDLAPKKLGVLTRITHEMRKFGTFGFEQLFRNDMVRASAKELDRVILYGSGSSNEPKGLFKMDGIQYYRAEDNTVLTRAEAVAVADWQGGELDFDGLDNMRGALEDADVDVNETFSYIGAPRYFRRLKQIKVSNFATQTSEKPYLLGSPMLRDETLRALIGDFGKSTQVKNKQLPGQSIDGATTDTSPGDDKFGDVVGANWSEVLVGRWSGVEIEDDGGTGTGFVRDETNVKLRLFADVGHRQELSIIACPDAQMRD